LSVWATITTWLAIILIVDGAIAFCLRRSLAQFIPGIDIQVIAITEIATGVAILAVKVGLSYLA
jgi:MprA protease rhombosortase-interaction domain-containing protein